MTQALVLSRWIHFAAVFALFGSALFWFYSGAWPNDGRSAPRSFRTTIVLLRIAAPVAAISGVAWLGEILANMTGGFANAIRPATLQIFFLQTQFGPVAILRLALFAGIVLLALLPGHGRKWLLAMLLAAALLLLSQAWLGHAAEGGFSPYGALLIFAYAVHMFAGAAWVGGLLPLLLTLIEMRRAEPHEPGRIALLARFSLMGTFAATLILVSGAANTAFHAVSPGKLVHSLYGEILLIKLSLVAGMLGFAYFNRCVAMPRLRDPSRKSAGYTGKLRASISLELVLGILVIGIAAVLGGTPPPR